MYIRVTVFLAFISFIKCAPAVDPVSAPSAYTTIKTQKVARGSIVHQVLKKPHNLLIGRCKPTDNVLHQENIILYNDGKSHVGARIRINVEGDVYITCANIYDEVPNGEGGYPSYAGGGVGHNYIEFNVETEYGKGFHFFVQIFGYELKNKTENAV
ncbi:uncharacterized protein LOC123006579 [Tribolium madens]|uniref:uncharacterized protein LOC123006579 n=1 Tax=Tribolium madens TaxID=41895 RepID=UPI001CF7531A|nr:uncharacterized protein LOC123006579 [Tribolium madens]